MRNGSLCSGYGGLDMAVEQFFGATTAWHCEYDDAPSKILAHRWDVPNHNDLTMTDWSAVEPVGMVTAGYPCQPFSQAGQRKGTDDERHLWPYVREAIRHLRPRYAFLENVAGHRSMGFDRVLGDCAEDGLHVRWCSVRASDIGAPHHRERLFILVSDPSRSGSETSDGLAGGGASRGGRNGWVDGSDRGASTDADDRQRDWDEPAQGRSAVEREASTGGGVGLLADPNLVGSQAGHERPERHGTAQSSSDGGRAALPDAANYGCERPREARDGRDGSADGSLGVDWGAYAPAIRRWERVTRPAPAPTELNSNGKPRLNAAFAEWMMGLPAGHVTAVPGLSRADQLKAIGNGVVPQQAMAALGLLTSIKAVA